MGCESSIPIKDEDQITFVEGKSPFYVNQSIQTTVKTPGGTMSKVKKYKRKLVPRLKSIESSGLITRRLNSLSSFTSTPLDSSPLSIQTVKTPPTIVSNDLMDGYYKYPGYYDYPIQKEKNLYSLLSYNLISINNSQIKNFYWTT